MTATSEVAPPTSWEEHRRRLTGYCYRMLGSAFDAEDAVQETLIRAWRHRDQLADVAAERAWLYRIATNVCLDMLRGAARRALPVDLAPPTTGPSTPGAVLDDHRLVSPIPDDRVIGHGRDPTQVAEERDSVRLAFIRSLQLLPPRQRAVLILRDVLCWSAREVAELLGVSVIAVNSALQRARETLAASRVTGRSPGQASPDNKAVLDRYVRAFEAFDLDALTALLHLEATLSMPPYDHWLQGPGDLHAWYAGPGIGCRGSLLCRLTANGSPAFGQYRLGGRAWALQVLEIRDGKIAAINSFLDTQRLFPLFGLPMERPF